MTQSLKYALMKLGGGLMMGGFIISTIVGCKQESALIPMDPSGTTALLDSITPTDSGALYLKNLKDYKSSNHLKAVGYYKGFTNLRSIPDSVDMVDIFGYMGPGNTGLWAPAKFNEIKSDIAYLKERGTEVVNCVWPVDLFDWHKNPDGSNVYTHSPEDYDKFAKYVYDYMDKLGLEGVDFDLEHGIMFDTPARNEQFILAFSKYFGPTSGTGKKLIIDTNLSFAGLGFKASTYAVIDKIIIQDYWGSESSSNSKIDGYIANGYPKEKIMLISADFEASYTATGTSTGPGRLQYYYTNPKYTAKVGGFGAYAFNHDKQKSYRYYREMIQKLNPAKTNSLD